jgi:hypothetical protein
VSVICFVKYPSKFPHSSARTLNQSVPEEKTPLAESALSTQIVKYTCEVQEDKMKGILVTFALLSGICAAAQTATVQPNAPVQKKSAVILMRVINTAEVTYHSQNGRYGDFQQLVSAHLLKWDSRRLPSGEQINPANPNEPVPGLHLNLSLVGEGSGYQTAVFAEDHGWGFYSNQDAVIFEMHPIE